MKIVSQAGEEIFDFESDALGLSFFWRCMVMAKFPDKRIDPLISANHWTYRFWSSVNDFGQTIHPQDGAQAKHRHRGNEARINDGAIDAGVYMVRRGYASWVDGDEEGKDRVVVQALFPFHEGAVDRDYVRDGIEKGLIEAEKRASGQEQQLPSGEFDASENSDR